MTATTVQLTGSGNFIVPGGVTALQIDCIGGGVGGTGGGFFPPKGGGAGAFARTNAAVVTPGQVIPYGVAPGYISPNGINQGDGGDTWFGDPNYSLPACLCAADGGNAYAGGSAALCKGDVKYSGGEGGHPIINGKGPSGAGAAGPLGAGSDGTTTTGGAADNGTVAGGIYPGGAGASGTNLPSGLGSGSGGGFDSIGGAGGSYGGGGAGGNNSGTNGGNPGIGLLLVTYDAAPVVGPRRRASIRAQRQNIYA